MAEVDSVSFVLAEFHFVAFLVKFCVNRIPFYRIAFKILEVCAGHLNIRYKNMNPRFRHHYEVIQEVTHFSIFLEIVSKSGQKEVHFVREHRLIQ